MTELLTLSNLSIVVLVLLVLSTVLVLAFYTYARASNRRLQQSIKLINDLYNISKKQSLALQKLERQISDNEINTNDDNEVATQNKAASDKLPFTEQDLAEEVFELRKIVSQLSQDVRVVENQTQQLHQDDPALKMYNKANQLVAGGASLEDIMEACELPRAEAEVLIGLHRKRA